MIYVITGGIHVRVGGQADELKAGDFFLPNLHTEISWDALGEHDIAVCFVIKPQFLEELCRRLNPKSACLSLCSICFAQRWELEQLLRTSTDLGNIAVFNRLGNTGLWFFSLSGRQQHRHRLRPRPGATETL